MRTRTVSLEDDNLCVVGQCPDTTVLLGGEAVLLGFPLQVLPHVLHVRESGLCCSDPAAHTQLAPTFQVLPLVRPSAWMP